MFKRFAIQAILLLVTAAAAQAAPRLELGPGNVSEGTVTIPVTLANEQGRGVAALSVDIGFDTAALENPTAVAGPAALAAGKGITVSYPTAGMVRLGIVGYNATVLGSGVVMVVTFTKNPGGNTGGAKFKYAFSAAGPAGDVVTVDTGDGVLTIK